MTGTAIAGYHADADRLTERYEALDCVALYDRVHRFFAVSPGDVLDCGLRITGHRNRVQIVMIAGAECNGFLLVVSKRAKLPAKGFGTSSASS